MRQRVASLGVQRALDESRHVAVEVVDPVLERAEAHVDRREPRIHLPLQPVDTPAQRVDSPVGFWPCNWMSKR